LDFPIFYQFILPYSDLLNVRFEFLNNNGTVAGGGLLALCIFSYRTEDGRLE